MKEINEINIDRKDSIPKDLILKYLGNWYWFILLGVIGMGIGYKMNVFFQSEYEISSSILPEQNTEGMTDLFRLNMFGNRSNVENHIEILSSYSLNRQALNNLNWKVYWYKKRLFKRSDLYKDAPFNLAFLDGAQNVTGLPVSVKVISDKKYLLSVEDKVKVNGEKQEIKFEQEGLFGEPFNNAHFHFILNKVEKVGIDPKDEYYFEFKNLNQLALTYRRKLDIHLAREKADIILLKIRGGQPKREADFLNELCDVYIQYNLRKKNQASENTIQFIDDQLSGIVDSLQITSRNYTNFRSRNRIVDLSQEGDMVAQRLNELESEESMARIRYEYYKNLQDYIKNSDQLDEQVIAPSVVGVTDPTLNSLVAKLSDLYGRRSTLSINAKETFPGLISVNKEIEQTRQMLNENLRNLINSVQVEIQNINNRKSQINSQLSRLPQTEQAFINVKRQFDINNELYTFLLERRAEAAITKASNIPDVQILDRAWPDTAVKIWPKTSRNALLGLLLGLFIPASVILLIYNLKTTITKKEEVDKFVKNSIVGEILHNSGKLELPVLKNPRSPISESFRHLRTNLKYLLYGEGHKVIAVHSSIPGEGKSFISINLASIIAMGNKKVLLVEGDLHKSSLNNFKVFKDLKKDKGLSTYLINHDKYEDIIIRTKIKNLSIVFSGAQPPNPSELLDSEKFDEFINRARRQFDIVVIDNAPTFTVTDSTLIGVRTDINLYVIRYDYSNKDQLKIIRDNEEKGLFKKIVYVLNDLKSSGHGSYKYYGEKYGYHTEARSKNWFQRLF
ncbi:MAG: hypothetical protein DRI95_14340 [Bacteroidetes bacterium]|nr:MAG: hypothetical protein DRI95_14340 [Bacteroidota bacterium]